MNQGAPDATDNGVVIGQGSAAQLVLPGGQVVSIPPRPPLPEGEDAETSSETKAKDTSPRTEPIPTIGDDDHLDALLAEEDLSGLTDYELMTEGVLPYGISRHGDEEIYFFRRHVREIITRLLMPIPKFIMEEDVYEETDMTKRRELEKKHRVQQRRLRRKRRKHPGWPSENKYGPRGYIFLVYGGLTSLVVSTIVGIVAPEHLPLMAVGWGVALLLLFYPVAREINRWRKRTVLIRNTDTGMRITYGEPNNVFFGFDGDGDGFTENIEGSVQIGSFRSWADKLIFLGCRDLHIGSKIEGFDAPRLENVPRAKEVQAFLNKSV